MADKRTELLDAARSLTGLRYRLDPPPRIDDGTIDCSLMVLEAAKNAGIPLPPGVRTAEQIRWASFPIAWDDVRPGDLLFFENTYNAGPPSSDGHIASHIGLSLGAGTRRMIDARERGASAVGETDISTPYWQERIFDARRLPGLAMQEPERPLDPVLPDPWRRWTAEQIAAAARVPVGAVRENWPRLVEQFARAGLTDDNTYYALIGTIAKESASTFRPIREFKNADGSIPHYWHGYDGGADFHGRGFIQNTHRSSYREIGPKIAALWGANPADPTFDLVTNPDNLLDPDMSAAAAAIFFRDKPGLARAAREGNWSEVRRLVLGGADPDGVARMATVAAALSAVGGPIAPAPPQAAQHVIRAEIDALIEHSQAMTNALTALRDRLPAA